jgi:FkbM family methyltransferase
VIVTSEIERVKIGGALLSVPRGHTLSFFRGAFPRYDRFLGLLASQLPRGSIVVDIGSNVGAIVAEMSHQNRSLTFICVEPSSYFRGFLISNLETLKSTSGVVASVVENPIGFSKGAPLVSSAGTARFSVLEDSGMTDEKKLETALLDFVTLDSLCLDLKAAVSLVKVDVDGWDFEVLESGAVFLNEERPDLYFEVDPFSEDTRRGYLDFWPKLRKFGYIHMIIFDNFGNYLTSSSEFDDAIFFIMKSGLPYKEKNSFYYVDIYVTTDEIRFDHMVSQVSDS